MFSPIRSVASTDREHYDLSVCIATLGSPDALRSIWSGLAGVKTARRWQLILVINGRDALSSDVVPWQTLGCDAMLLHEPRPGKSRALNLAIEAATGDLLVFTDDDVVPDEQWLDQLAAAAADHPQIDVFGGRIRAKGEVPQWIRDSSNLQQALLSEHDYGDSDNTYAFGHYPIGPNMAVRRSVVARRRARWVETIGPGTRLPVGDESAFLAQISSPGAGDRLYIASAVVHHTVDGRYFPLRRAVRRAFQIGLSAGRLASITPLSSSPRQVSPQKLSLRIATRIVGLRSSRELLCVLARLIGVSVGRFYRAVWR